MTILVNLLLFLLAFLLAKVAEDESEYRVTFPSGDTLWVISVRKLQKDT